MVKWLLRVWVSSRSTRTGDVTFLQSDAYAHTVATNPQIAQDVTSVTVIATDSVGNTATADVEVDIADDAPVASPLTQATAATPEDGDQAGRIDSGVYGDPTALRRVLMDSDDADVFSDAYSSTDPAAPVAFTDENGNPLFANGLSAETVDDQWSDCRLGRPRPLPLVMAPRQL